LKQGASLLEVCALSLMCAVSKSKGAMKNLELSKRGVDTDFSLLQWDTAIGETQVQLPVHMGKPDWHHIVQTCLFTF
jgi:hypothetical protein